MLELNGTLKVSSQNRKDKNIVTPNDDPTKKVHVSLEQNANPKRTTLVVFLLLLFSALGLSFWMILPYVLALIMGSILSLLTQPVFQRLRRHHIKPKTSAVIVTLAVLFLIIAPISFFTIIAIRQGIALGQNLADGGFSFRSLIDRISTWGPIETIVGSPEAFEAQVRRWIQSAGSGATTAVLATAAQFPNMILQLVLASLACFFFLIDGGKFKSWIANKLPMDKDVQNKLAESFKNTSASVIWATVAAALSQSAVILVGYLVLGVPAAFLAAGATFIFAWIPILGSTPVWVAAAIYLYLQSSILKTILMLAFGMVAGVIDNFVRPLVLKGRSRMHPLVSLVAIFGGISMFGIMGVFIGPILAAVVISLLQIWPVIGARSGFLSEQHVGVQIDLGNSPDKSIKRAG